MNSAVAAALPFEMCPSRRMTLFIRNEEASFSGLIMQRSSRLTTSDVDYQSVLVAGFADSVDSIESRNS